MKKYIYVLATLLLLIVLLAACIHPNNGGSGSNKSNSSGSSSNTKDVSYEIEDDEAEIQKVKKDISAFYGDWEATSNRASYLYGNINITVNENKTWSGNITGEKLEGTWTDNGDFIHMNNDLFSFDLAFDKSGSLVFIDSESNDEIDIVLTRK